MHPLVRDAYKRLLWVGRDYPRGGLAAIRERAKAGFREHAALTDTEAIIKAVHAARWYEKEIVGVVRLAKYRAMVKHTSTPDAAAAQLRRRVVAISSGRGATHRLHEPQHHKSRSRGTPNAADPAPTPEQYCDAKPR
jgi:hypothetical protein